MDDQQESSVLVDGAVAGETPTELPVEAAETTKSGKEKATDRSAVVFVKPSREEIEATRKPQMRNPDPDKAHEGATEEASDLFAKPKKMPEEVAEATKISLEGAVQSESLSDPVHETGMVVQQVLVRGEAKDKVANAGSHKDSGQPMRNPDPSRQPEEATEGLGDVFVPPSREEVATMEEPQMRNPDPDRPHEGVTEEASDIFSRPGIIAEEPSQGLVHEEKSKGKEEVKHDNTALSADAEPKLRNPDPLYPSEELQGTAEEFSRPPDKVNKEKTDTDQNENPVSESEILSGKDQYNISTVDDDELPWAMYRDMKKIDKDVEEDGGFSADDETDSEGRQHCHSQRVL